MSLSSILDEIQGDAERLEPTEAVQAPVIESDDSEVGLEQFEGLQLLQSRQAALSQTLLVRRTIQECAQRPVLERAVAAELFTMLPATGRGAPVLTQGASRHNRDTLLRRMDDIGHIDDQCVAFTAELLAVLNKTNQLAVQVSRVCEYTLAVAQTHLARLRANPPMVIHDGKGVNLLQAELTLVSNLDTTRLDFPAYAGVLDAKFRALRRSIQNLQDSAPQLLVSLKGDVLSLESVTERLIELCRSAIGLDLSYERITRLMEAIGAGRDAYSGRVGDEALQTILQLQLMEQMFLREGSVPEHTLACLEFLV